MQDKFINMLFFVAAIVVATIIVEKLKERKAKKGNSLTPEASGKPLEQSSNATSTTNV